jgi:hypothetical protein
VGDGGGGTMYTHVSEWKNNKIKGEKKENNLSVWPQDPISLHQLS